MPETRDPAAWAQRFPPVVVAELSRRRAELLAEDLGRVLDFDEPGSLELACAAADHPAVPGVEPGGYDTVLSTAALVEAPDLHRALAGALALLNPEGELVLVEPVGVPGWLGLLTASVGSLLPPVTGLHLARDVPQVVRSVGFTPTTLERFTVDTPVWPLRHFVQVRAATFPEEPDVDPTVRSQEVPA